MILKFKGCVILKFQRLRDFLYPPCQLLLADPLLLLLPPAAPFPLPPPNQLLPMDPKKLAAVAATGDLSRFRKEPPNRKNPSKFNFFRNAQIISLLGIIQLSTYIKRELSQTLDRQTRRHDKP